MKKHLTSAGLVLVLLLGVALLLYPTVSDYWNSLHQSRVIADYSAQSARIDTSTYQAMLADAAEYNRAIRSRANVYALSEEERTRYESLLNLNGDGVMAYLEIPKIRCKLPIYHGTSEPVLQVGVGHLDWTALPVGGAGTHCVLSAHSNLGTATLFTELEQLETGDTFTVTVLNEVLLYEVDQILEVRPNETEALLAAEGEDYCTLLTCTGSGNVHRLLVRGKRCERAQTVQTTEAQETPRSKKPLVIAIVVLLALLVGLFLYLKFRKHHPKGRFLK